MFNYVAADIVEMSMGSDRLKNEIGSIELVVDLYNRFSRTGRSGPGMSQVLMSHEDSASLMHFIEMHCAAAHDAILAYQEQHGVDWFVSEHAERFLAREYYIVRRVLDGRERGVLRLRDLSFLDSKLASFAPRPRYGLPGSRSVGAYFMPLSDVATALLHHLDEVTWPPANPVQQLKEGNNLSQKTLACSLSTSIHRVRNLLNGEGPLSKQMAHLLSKLVGVSADRIQVAYDMHRFDTTLHVESPGNWIDPREVDGDDLPTGSESVAMEIRGLSFRICLALLELLRSSRIRIERCTYCGNLYLPKPHSHRHARNYCCEKHRQQYNYSNP